MANRKRPKGVLLPLSVEEKIRAQEIARYHGISLSGLLRSLLVKESERIDLRAAK